MFLWSIFKIGSVTAHCGQCKHWRISHDSEPCASCIQGQMSKSKDIVLVVSGKCFEPRDPERFEDEKRILESVHRADDEAAERPYHAGR